MEWRISSVGRSRTRFKGHQCDQWLSAILNNKYKWPDWGKSICSKLLFLRDNTRVQRFQKRVMMGARIKAVLPIPRIAHRRGILLRGDLIDLRRAGRKPCPLFNAEGSCNWK